MTKLFKKIYCEISGACNLTCDFCPLTDEPRGFMELDLFQKIADEVAEISERIYLHVMGEPLLHPQFDQFIKACEKRKLAVHLVTNGMFLNKKVDSVLNPTVREVNISLQSFAGCHGEDADDSEYLKTIFEFIETAFEKRPDMHVNLRLWNLGDFGSVVDHNRTLLEKIYDHFDEEIPEFSIGARHHGRSVRVKNNLFMNYSTRFLWPSLDAPFVRKKGYCMGATTQLGIHSDGTVVPCCLDNNATIKLGNVKDHSLREIITHERADRMRSGLDEAKLVEEMCQRCEFASRFRKKIRYRR